MPHSGDYNSKVLASVKKFRSDKYIYNIATYLGCYLHPCVKAGNPNWLVISTTITNNPQKVCQRIRVQMKSNYCFIHFMHIYIYLDGGKVKPKPKPSSTEIFYVAVGVASAIIILVAVVIFTLYIRTRRQTVINNDRPR